MPSMRLVLPDPFLPSRTVNGSNRLSSASAKFLKSFKRCMAFPDREESVS